MTGENRRANVAAEVARAVECMESAEILLAAGKHADAVSRAYYATLHWARALLLTSGEEARSHTGVTRLLHRDLVRTGRLDADVARLFSRLQQLRQDADYTAEFVFTAAGAGDEVAAARRFAEAAATLLRREGWLPSADGSA